MTVFLGLDIGTTSTIGILADTSGDVLALADSDPIGAAEAIVAISEGSWAALK